MKLKIIAEPVSQPVRLEGALTIYHAETARAALLTEMNRRAELLLDLGGVNACDSAGAQFLLAARNSAAAAGKAFAIRAGSPAVDLCLDHLGFAGTLPDFQS